MREVLSSIRRAAANHGADEEWFAKWDRLANELRKAKEERDDVVHGLWAAGSTRDTLTVFRFRDGRREPEISDWSVGRLQALAESCESLHYPLTQVAYSFPHLVGKATVDDDGMVHLGSDGG